MTDKQLSTLRHMLGINGEPWHKVPKPWRNYAAVTPGDPYFLELARLGLVRCYRLAGHGSSYDWYTCTEAGEQAARQSYFERRWPKSKRVYHRYLETIDSYPDLTFKQFLVSPQFAETRRDA